MPPAPSGSGALSNRLLGGVAPSDADVEGSDLGKARAAATSYYARQAGGMSALRLRGLPHMGACSAGAVGALYAGLALISAAMYYATMGVQPTLLEDSL